MKKIIPFGLAIALLTTTASSTHAQFAFNNKKFRADYLSESNNHFRSNETKDAATMQPNAVTNFITAFPNATNAGWTRLRNGESLVHFFSDDIETKVFYNRKGKHIATIRYYDEYTLPAEVRHLVKSAYYDFTIFLVIEVTINNQTAYLVKIEDNTRIKTVRVLAGEMDVLEELEKM
ncbi:hypothetical protein [Longitalea luteola]|uniref:hypothetical protein n=1 Tax=Longitalea luteola TaxID=2812563 RepID=UPI001A95CEB3|nr:hypothetical protein [Longitalea luteola]